MPGERDHRVARGHCSHRNGQEPLAPGLEGAPTAIFEDLGLPEDEHPEVARKPAAALIRRMERDLVGNIYRWTGHFPERTRPLVRRLAGMADTLKQVWTGRARRSGRSRRWS